MHNPRGDSLYHVWWIHIVAGHLFGQIDSVLPLMIPCRAASERPKPCKSNIQYYIPIGFLGPGNQLFHIHCIPNLKLRVYLVVMSHPSYLTNIPTASKDAIQPLTFRRLSAVAWESVRPLSAPMRGSAYPEDLWTDLRMVMKGNIRTESCALQVDIGDWLGRDWIDRRHYQQTTQAGRLDMRWARIS